MPRMPESLELIVKSIAYQADGINAWEFCRPDGGELPPFTAGAHIDLQLANGMVRSYSLCNAQEQRHRYIVAINRDPTSRGGSKLIHDTVRAGDKIRILPPENNFQLIEDASHTVLIAGGIGITPIWSMIQRLEALGRSWALHYSTRSRQMCAFKEALQELESQKPGRVHFNFDQEPGGRMTDLKALIATLSGDAHVYCCGPTPMLQAFEAAMQEAGWPQTQVHVEYFTAKQEAAVEGGFTVVLQRRGASFQIPPGKTILDVLLENKVDAPFSCTQGVCGSCEMKVLEGVPDHRDSILTSAEQASNSTMMICCSGSKSERLVLDF